MNVQFLFTCHHSNLAHLQLMAKTVYGYIYSNEYNFVCFDGVKILIDGYVIPHILNTSHLVLTNLEVPVKADESRNDHKNFIHYSLPKPTEDLLTLLNISCVSLANNHIYDCKMSGLKKTISILDKLGIYHTGAGWLPEHVAPIVIEKNGYRIGFLAYVDKTTKPMTENFPELLINYFDLDTVKKDIQTIRATVDKVILSVHWGVDYSFYPTPSQRLIARELVDAGVDIIMGHHPHTLQPYEKHNDGFIFYSLGGLTFGDYIKEGKTELQALFRKTKQSIIANYDISENTFAFASTHEHQGNYVNLTARNYEKWSRKKWRLFAIKHSSATATKIFNFKEKILDRTHEYFFGYYKHPLKRLKQFSNIHKIKRLFNDFRQG